METMSRTLLKQEKVHPKGRSHGGVRVGEVGGEAALQHSGTDHPRQQGCTGMPVVVPPPGWGWGGRVQRYFGASWTYLV